MPENRSKTLSRYLKSALFSAISGLLAGIAATLLLYLLDLATKIRDSRHQIIWFLPLAGFLIGWTYHRFGRTSGQGNGLVIDTIHDPQEVLPFRITPFVLLGTVITHLFGGSAGREGTAVQMGASLSDQLSKIFHVEPAERKILLVAGAGAGFGAAAGASFAGVIFGMEVISIRRLKFFAPFECFIASFVAYYTAIFFEAPHSIYPAIKIPGVQLSTALFVILAGLCFGLCAQIFVRLTHVIEHLQNKFVPYPPLRPLFAGIVLSILFVLSGAYQYAGLGINVIQQALVRTFGFEVPILKIIFTALTVGSGFKGGEFIPLVFIGTTFGGALSHFIPISHSLLAALGFAAVFGAGANTPIACTLMAMEIFGPKIGLYAWIACLAAYYVSGHRGIYKTQRIERHKWANFKFLFAALGEIPKRFFNDGR